MRETDRRRIVLTTVQPGRRAGDTGPILGEIHVEAGTVLAAERGEGSPTTIVTVVAPGGKFVQFRDIRETPEAVWALVDAVRRAR